MKKRVVITGTGLVTPLGNGTKDTWDGLNAGRSGLDHITRFNVDGFKSQVAGEVRNFHCEQLQKKYGADAILERTYEYGHLLSVIDEALNDAGLSVRGDEHLCMGSGGINKLSFADMVRMQKQYNACSAKELKSFVRSLNTSCRDFLYLGQERNEPAFFMNRILGLRTVPRDIHVACATGAQVIASGYDMILSGAASRVICCAVQALDFWKYIGFTLLDAMAECAGEPCTASRPFDKKRNGLVLAEGAACVILEDMASAEKRNPDGMYAEIAGYGVTTDAYRLTDPRPDGIHAAAAMNIALQCSGMKAEQIDYINAHGTSTRENDRVETRAIKNVFGKKSYDLLINATKSMTGHMLASSGLVETVVTALSLHEGRLHPTLNLDEPDPECDLNYLAGNCSIKEPVASAITNSFGFGGHNISLVLKKIV